MEERLLQRFAQQFKQLDQPVSEADLTAFLDRSGKGTFDREVFEELAHRAYSKYGALTPHSFVRVYYEALETLKRKSEHTMADLNNIDYSIRMARDETMVKLEFRNLRLDNPADPANFVTIDMTRNCALNFYSLQDEQDVLFVPVALVRRNEPLRITLQNLRAHIVDSKNVDISQEVKKNFSEVSFLDGSTLTFALHTEDIAKKDCLSFLIARKNDLQEYQVHTATKHALLIETFPDLFAGSAELKQSNATYSTSFKLACALSALMFILGLFLSAGRSYFIEIFVAIAFFGNVYIFRNFRVFFAIRLIAILAGSILLDLVWGYIEAYKLSRNYVEPLRGFRIANFIIAILLLIVKVALIFLYNNVYKEDEVQGFLRLNDDTFWAERASELDLPRSGQRLSHTKE